MTEGDYVSIESASQLTGIPARTLRRWASDGKVAAVAGQGKKLIRLGDVHKIVAMTGRPAGQPDMTEESAGHVTDQVTDNGLIVSPAASAQLAAIRDQWLQPLVDQIGELNRDLGRVTAERDAAIAEIERMKSSPHEPTPQAPEPTPQRPWWKIW